MWDFLRRWFSRPSPEADEAIWCVAATVIEAQPVGDSAVRTGTKHFRAGAKVYCFPALWGDGLENLQVIGHGRWKGRFVQVILPSKRLAHFRVERVYSPWVKGRMKPHWNAGEESRRKAEDMVRWLGERHIETTPLTPGLLAVFQSARFWRDYFWMDERDPPPVYAELARAKIDFPLPGDYSLILMLSQSLDQHVLYLAHPSRKEPWQLGWDDQAQWCPQAFRWDEMDAICRCLARRDSRFPYPGWPLLLLFRFAPLTNEDDAEAAHETLRQAWNSLGVFEPAEIETLLERLAWVWTSRWERKNDRWIATGDDAYSLRGPENPDFPFALVEDLVERAGRQA